MPFHDLFGHESSKQTDPHDWKLPRHFPPAINIEDQPKIPDPAIFNDLLISQQGQVDSDPTVSELAVHLCLLECFFKFKQSVLRSDHLDEVLHIPPPPEYSDDEKGKQEGLSASNDATWRRSRKWDIVLQLAVSRFQAWWQKIEGIMTHAAAYSRFRPRAGRIQLDKDYLPPLDVLMVWHSYVLGMTFSVNPNESDRKLKVMDFPFRAIYDAVDREKFSYHLTKPAQNIFLVHLGQSADLLTDFSMPPAYSADSTALPSYTEQPTYRPTFDFTGAINTYEGLIDQAHSLLWIRSPALQGSLKRALQGYQNCGVASFEDLSDAPFDIALAWTTHRLNPSSYHPVPPMSLKQDPAMAPSSPIYSPYSPTCLCWTHEAIASTLSSSSSIPSASGTLSSTQIDTLKTTLGYHLAVETARQTNHRLPVRWSHWKTKRAREKEEKAKEWTMEFGLHYHEEIVPAKYDRHGRMVRGEERRVVREKGYVSAAGVGWMMCP